jgi:glycosyltransferase involved in cell wall biosynthesis
VTVIGIDARAAAEVPAGRGRYVRELLRALEAQDTGADRFILYAREAWVPPEGGLDAARFSWSLVGARDPLWHLVAAAKASRACDVFLSTNSYLTAWLTTVPTAVVVYDLVPFVDGAQAQSRAAKIERATIRPALRRARALACISEATRADLVRLFPRSAARATTIPLAADPAFGAVEEADVTAACARHGLTPRGFVLAAGTLEPRKNLERLIGAWAALPPEVRAGRTLALVGPPGWELDGILGAAQTRAGEVTLTGFVSDADLAALYAGCAAFAYPSLYEGFGLPVLEAMSAGAPVITSSESSLPEVAGDAALLVDPLDVGAISEALRRVLTDEALADSLRARGRGRAAEFSWSRTATETLTLLRQLASTRS